MPSRPEITDLILKYFISRGGFKHFTCPKMVADTLSLTGKVALITGSGRENGIGGAIAKILAKNGASVVIHYVSSSSASRAHALADSLRKSNATAVVVQGDLSTEEGTAKIVSDALKALETDKIDILGKFGPRPDCSGFFF
jgi:short chain dehydrogenase